MQRYPLYDPPEYVSWQADPALVKAFAERIARDPERAALVATLDRANLLALYRGLLRFRLHDIALKRWVRQGVMSKAWLGTGEEAVTIGSVHALEKGDAVGPMIRNAGACHEMGMSIADMFRGYFGTSDSPTAGKDLHVGDLAKGIITPISHVASLVPVLAGIALAHKLRGEPRVALTYIGDGATRTAEFHEGMNFAAVQKLPFLAVVQDNGIALGTRTEVHTSADLALTGKAYGIPSYVADGNNVLDMWAATRLAADRARRGDGASVIVAKTFRMGGHATHDEAEGRRIQSRESFAEWGRRDPVGLYEEHLVATGVANRAALDAIEGEVKREIEAAEVDALHSKSESMPKGPESLDGVYAAG